MRKKPDDKPEDAPLNNAPQPAPEPARPEDESQTPTPEMIAEWQRKAAEYDALYERLLRTRADFENARKRLERNMRDRANFAIEEFANELLPVADNLARAIQAAQHHDTIEKILEGVQLVEKQLYDALNRHGVTPIVTEKGQPFDPNIHEAVGAVPSADQPGSTIVQETQRGFMIHKRLLRPAKVLVSAPPGDDAKPAPAENDPATNEDA